MPRDSHFVHATVGEQAAWGAVEHLLATLIDATQTSTWLYVSAHSKTRVERPKPHPRPGVAEPDDGTRIGSGKFTMTEMRSMLDNWSGDNAPTERT